MLAFIVKNIATILISFILIAVVVLIIIHLRNEKKKGKSSCGGKCSNCPMSGKCHSK